MISIRSKRSIGAKVISVLSVLACLQGALFASTVNAESIQELNGNRPLSAAELASYTGGFSLEGGFNVNLGVEIDSYVNQVLVTRQIFSTNTASNSAVNTGGSNSAPSVTLIPGNGGVTQVITQAGGNLSTVINNTASNVNINQTKSISLDIANFSQIMGQNLVVSKLGGLQGQILSSIQQGLHH
jgi:hypothetical protein